MRLEVLVKLLTWILLKVILLVVFLLVSADVVELGLKSIGDVELVCELVREVLVRPLVLMLKVGLEVVVVPVELTDELTVIADSLC